MEESKYKVKYAEEELTKFNLSDVMCSLPNQENLSDAAKEMYEALKLWERYFEDMGQTHSLKFLKLKQAIQKAERQ